MIVLSTRHESFTLITFSKRPKIAYPFLKRIVPVTFMNTPSYSHNMREPQSVKSMNLFYCNNRRTIHTCPKHFYFKVKPTISICKQKKQSLTNFSTCFRILEKRRAQFQRIKIQQNGADIL